MPDPRLHQSLASAKRAVNCGLRNIQKKEKRIALFELHQRDATDQRRILQMFLETQKLHEEHLPRIEAEIKREEA